MTSDIFTDVTFNSGDIKLKMSWSLIPSFFLQEEYIAEMSDREQNWARLHYELFN